jgi:hypothetical protein
MLPGVRVSVLGREAERGMTGARTGERRARTEMAQLGTDCRVRRALLASPAFRAAGWLVGSGATARGHQPVMPARRQRAGMRWAQREGAALLAKRLAAPLRERGVLRAGAAPYTLGTMGRAPCAPTTTRRAHSPRAVF